MTITGHSLGGGIAATAGAVTGYPTNTYNAAGVHKHALKRFGVSDLQTKHIQAYSTVKDPLSVIQDNRVAVLAGTIVKFPRVGIAAASTGALPKAIGNRIKVLTDDSYVSGHSTDGMGKILNDALTKK